LQKTQETGQQIKNYTVDTSKKIDTQTITQASLAAVGSVKEQLVTSGKVVSDLTQKTWEPIQKSLDEKGVTRTITQTSDQLK
jgi:hypothetical protein